MNERFRTGNMPAVRPLKWDRRMLTAVTLMAENELKDAEIAEQIGVSTNAVRRWRQHPEFAAAVGDALGQIQAGVLRLAIAKKHKRLEGLNALRSKLYQTVQERAEEYEASGETAGGATTGVIVKQERVSGVGSNQVRTTEFQVDTGLIRSILELDRQAAQELGQWETKQRIEHVDGITREYVIVGVDVPSPSVLDPLQLEDGTVIDAEGYDVG